MNGGRTLTVSENLRILDELRPIYERVKTERIRAEGEVERLTRELDEVRRAARDQFGTDDEIEIAGMIDSARLRTTALVEAFAERVRSVEQKLAQLGDDE